MSLGLGSAQHDPSFDHDVLVIGSGFGGSVSALRLTEKGYRVGVVEAGKRWTKDTLPETNWDVRRFLWFPRLGMRGFQRLTLLKDVFILSGAAVGGGSVVYANTLYRPLANYWNDAVWAHLTDWREELLPHYDQAERMLGATPTPFETNADHVIKEVGRRLGVEDTFHPTNVGVWFGEPDVRVPDPYFGGEGPDRVGCIKCGGCMVGCRFEAKNTLTDNYLYLAEKNGAEVVAEREVVDLRELAHGGWEVTTERPGAWINKDRRTHTAEQVVFSAGALGTQKLLFKLRDEGRLPNVSHRLGTLTRTNSEALVGATASTTAVDYSEGVAITSSIHPDEDTHIEPVRYPKGSNMMSLLATVMVDGGGRIPRWLRFLLTILLHPILFLRSLSARKWAERSIILLVMQSLDNSLETFRKRGLFGWKLSTRQGHGEPNPRWIPTANRAAREAADVMDGQPLGSIFEATMNVPATAHIIGGCPIGETPEDGVVDPYHRVHGHPGLHVVDGSTITANLGVNPSLTITAMAERAMSLWPNAGDEDPRPALGAPYERVEPVAPHSPAVPADAPAALRTSAPAN
ncbi:MAG: GMC family oxidoreductase [Nitriliruptorales bacterium]|nr:GMC family oxidoreductase [Nitriliruptorales bacterium]